MVKRNFGTFRGAVRLLLSYLELAGGVAGVKKPGRQAIKRLVFVCHGNICRSAFADALARKHGLRSASFGLSTTSGNSAYAPAATFAQTYGLDLSGHGAIAVEDFEPQEGDLLLAMETRQLRRIAGDERLKEYPRMLLGAFASPPVPHLHDPYKITPEYLPVCLGRVASAVEKLGAKYPGAKAS